MSRGKLFSHRSLRFSTPFLVTTISAFQWKLDPSLRTSCVAPALNATSP